MQYLRGLAALSVVVSHCDTSAIVAQAGVDIFFVISGFIMWTLTERQTDPAEYWWNRIVRIVPLYWCFTAVIAVHQHAPVMAVLKSLLFIPYFGVDGRMWPVIVAGWTLNYEMAFYFLIGLALLLNRKRQLWFIAAALAAASALHHAVPDIAPALFYTDPILLEFLAGGVLAALAMRGRLPGVITALCLICAGVVAYWLPLWVRPEDWRRVVAWGIPAICIVCGFLALEARQRLPKLPRLKTLGDASYALYLLHPLVVGLPMRLLRDEPLVIRVGVPVCWAVLLGLLLHLLVEKPATNWLRRAKPAVVRRRHSGAESPGNDPDARSRRDGRTSARPRA